VLATVPEADIARLGVNAISVGQVSIAPVQIGQLVLTNFDFRTAVGVVHLREFRVTITINIRVDWHIHIPLPIVPDIDEGGTISTINASFTIDFGDITIPGLQNLSIHIDSFTAANIAAASNPLTNLQLGSVVAEQIRARNLVLPAQGFTIAGLTIGSLQAAGISVPAAGVDQITIGRVHGEVMPMGDITITNFALPNTAVSDIVSQGDDVSATEVSQVLTADAGILRLTFTVTPTVRTQIDRLEIANATASTTIGSIELHNIVAPYEFLNLTLSQIGIDTISIPSFAIS